MPLPDAEVDLGRGNQLVWRGSMRAAIKGHELAGQHPSPGFMFCRTGSLGQPLSLKAEAQASSEVKDLCRGGDSK